MTAWETIREAPRRIGEAAAQARPQLRSITSPRRRMAGATFAVLFVPELPDLRVSVVRAAAVVGPGVDTTISRHFESPRLLVVAGSRPCWQFCHVDDLVSALEFAALEKVDGEVAVGCDGWLEQEEVEELSSETEKMKKSMKKKSKKDGKAKKEGKKEKKSKKKKSKRSEKED